MMAARNSAVQQQNSARPRISSTSGSSFACSSIANFRCASHSADWPQSNQPGSGCNQKPYTATYDAWNRCAPCSWRMAGRRMSNCQEIERSAVQRPAQHSGTTWKPARDATGIHTYFWQRRIWGESCRWRGSHSRTPGCSKLLHLVRCDSFKITTSLIDSSTTSCA